MALPEMTPAMPGTAFSAARSANVATPPLAMTGTVVAATCSYDGVVNAAFRSGNVFATQFHPEKSGPAGLALLRNFVQQVAVEVSA